MKVTEWAEAPLRRRAKRAAGEAKARPWGAPTALIALALVPVAAGAARIAQLARGDASTPDTARFVASPLPVVLHVIGATLFCILGALQFAPALRRQRHRWHRAAGFVVLPAGLVAAFSGLWMALLYQLPAGEDHPLLKAFRLVFGVGMVLALLLGFLAILRRDLEAHRAWMVRSYGIGIGAGTQALMMIPWSLLLGRPTGITHALLMGAAWALNLVVAERLV